MKLTVSVEVHVAWWLRAWLWCLAAASLLSGCEPSPERVTAMVKRGVSVRLR